MVSPSPQAARRAALLVFACVLCAALLTASRPRPLGDERVMESLYHVERQAGRGGWTPALARQAGDLWRASGDLVRAVAYWERAEPDPQLLRHLAQAYLELGEWARALDTLERLRQRSPDDPWVNFQLGVILAAFAGERALPYLNVARAVYGDTLDDVIDGARRGDSLRVGMALAEQQMWAYAELAFGQVEAPRAYAYLGYARDQQGKDGGAWIDAAVALAPTDPQVRLLQGLHWRTLEDYAASLAAISAAAALAPENPTIHAQLGTAYDLLGDPAGARRWYAYAVTLSGNDPQFQAILDAFDAEQNALLDAIGVDLGFTAEPELGSTDEAVSTPAATTAPVE